MAKLQTVIRDTTTAATAYEVTLASDDEHCQGGLLANLDTGGETLYIGGAGQSGVDNTTGFPLAAGDVYFVDAEVSQGFGFYVYSVNACEFAFLPSAKA